MNEEILKQILSSTRYILPEIILTCGILFIIFINVISRSKKFIVYSFFTIIALLSAASATVNLFPFNGNYAYFDMIAVDNFSLFFRLLFILSTLLLVLISLDSKEFFGYSPAEYHVLILSMLIGMNLLASANNLLMIYLSIEMMSTASYILAGYLKRQKDSLEASLKYLIYGAMSSGIMLFGFSYLYGLTGELKINLIKEALHNAQIPPPFMLFIIILILVGVGFKISAVPFHFWAPDVYQGAPTAITAHLSVASKAAGFALLFRLFFTAFSYQIPGGKIVPLNVPWTYLIAVLAVATMTLGNLIALWQKNIKRLLAYSSIAHAGYMLMGLVMLNEEGTSAVLFYLVSYLIMNLGAFYIAISLYPHTGSYDIEKYAGLWKKRPFAVLAMTFFMLSLTGIPPFIGFFSKFILFAAVIRAGWMWLAVIAVLNSVISLYYYMCIIKVMVIDPPATLEKGKIAWFVYGIALLLAILSLIFGPAFNYIYQFAQYSSHII